MREMKSAMPSTQDREKSPRGDCERTKMIYGFRSVFVIAASAIIASVLGPCSSRAQVGPELVKTLHTSDIHYRFTHSPDRKAVSVVLDNFDVALVAGDGAVPTVIRVFPLWMPVRKAGKGATVRVRTRGKLACPEGVTCTAIVWMNGFTNVLDLPANKTSGEFLGDAHFSVPGANVLQAAVILVAERQTKRNDIAAMIKVDSLELTIAPPVVAGGTKK